MSSDKPVLYSYWRSSCSWRVRIALAWKNIDYEYKTVNLLDKNAVNDPAFVSANPVQKVPALVVNGKAIGESLAIIEYLEEAFPGRRALLPSDPVLRAHSRAIALQIGAGIQPIQNSRVLQYLNKQEAGSGQKWAAHWIEDGLKGLEGLLEKYSGKYCVGDEVTIADLFIPSMVYNALRFKVDVAPFKLLNKINENLAQLPEFQNAVPDKQPDAGLNA